MEFFRVGDKTVSLNKISTSIEQILKMRSQGRSQQDVAEALGLDRSFISRLENLGEIRKGKNIGVVGFPIKNKEEIISIFRERGIENCLLMNEAERSHYVMDKSGSDLMNQFMALLKEYRRYDTVIVMASDMRTRMIGALLDQQVFTVDIGSSPLTEDVVVDPDRVRDILDHLLKP